MNRLRFNPRYSGPLDVGPCCDIDRSVYVGVCGIPAHLTEKDGLGLPVGLLAVSATATGTRRVARVYPNGRDARPLRLVRCKLLELVEGPGVQVVSLSASNLYPSTDVLQVLKSKSQTVALRGSYKIFADAMVYVSGKAPLTSREFFQLALSRVRTTLLQTLTKAAALATNLVDVCPGVSVAERVGSEVDDARVYAKVALYIFGGRLRDATRRQQVKLASNVNKVGLALLKLQEFELTRPGAEKHLLPTLKRPDGHAELIRLPFQDAAVIGNSTVGLERAKRLFVQLVSVSYFGLASHDHLRRKREGVFRVIVDQTVKAELPESLGVLSHLRHVVTRLVRPFKRRQQCGVLFRGGQELDFRRQFHPSILTQLSRLEHCATPALPRSRNFLPRLKAKVSISVLR